MKEGFLKLPSWMKSNVFYRTKLSDDYVKKDSPEEDKDREARKHTPVHPYDANLVSSENPLGKHTLMLDLDTPHFYVESSSEGHGHLVINTDLDLEALIEIITVLNKYKIIQDGILNQLKNYGHLSIRLPGQNKYDGESNAGLEEYKESLKKPKETVVVTKKTDVKLNTTADFSDLTKTFKQIYEYQQADKKSLLSTVDNKLYFLDKLVKDVEYQIKNDAYTIWCQGFMQTLQREDLTTSQINLLENFISKSWWKEE